jgi:hypothetical protein
VAARAGSALVVRRRRHRRAARAADRPHRGARRGARLGRRARRRHTGDLPGLPARRGGRSARHLHRPGRRALLPRVRAGPGADVGAHQPVRRPPRRAGPHRRRAPLHPVHRRGLDADARRDPRPRELRRDLRPARAGRGRRSRPVAPASAARRGAARPGPGGQGAGLPAAHLAAAGPHHRAHRRVGAARGRAAEDGHLRPGPAAGRHRPRRLRPARSGARGRASSGAPWSASSSATSSG